MNKITKRIILVVVTVLLAVAMQAVVSTKQVKAEVKNGEIKEMKWSFDTDTGTLAVSGETENYSDFFKAIGIDAKAVKTLKVGKDVEYLKFNSEGCENVTTVELESEKTLMFMDSATYGMKNLTTVKHGESVVEKYDADSATIAFGQLLIKKLIIKDAEEIGDECFNRLSKVENVELPDSLKVIGEKCFQGLETLSEITLSKNIEEIGKDSFKDCKELTIKAEEKSEAYEFAEENDINVEAIKKSGLKLSGAIIGIIIGCVVAAILFIVLIVVIILVIKSKKKKQAE